MGWGVFSIGLLCALGLLLLAAGVEDARHRTISNWTNAAVALLAPAWWWAEGLPLWPAVPLQLGLALLALVVFAGAFALGMMGGGDVKLIVALALWLPALPFFQLLVAMSLIGGGVTILMMAERRWRPAEGPLEVPYGVAIACAGLLSLREPILNQLA
jgi:prepilin peptidase CpaA